MFELDVSRIPELCNLVEDYKENPAMVISDSTLRSIVILSLKFFPTDALNLLNLKVAMLLAPDRVMTLNDSKTESRNNMFAENRDAQRKMVLEIKEKLDITLKTIRELVLDANDNRFNILPLELKYQVLYSLDPDLVKIPEKLWLPDNVDLEHLARRDQKIDQALQDKQVSNTAVLSYHQFRRNNGCPDSITRLAIKDNQNLIKERLMVYMQQRKLPQQLDRHKRLLLVHTIGKEQSETPRLTVKKVDRAIEAAIKKLDKQYQPSMP
jgi:hypothetical protein